MRLIQKKMKFQHLNFGFKKIIFGINKNNYSISSNNTKPYIGSYLYKLHLYKKIYYKKNWILDEGLVQVIVCLVYENDWPLTSINIFLDKLMFCDNIKYIYMNTNFEQVKKNIIARNRHVCYVDELVGDELMNLLTKQKEIMDFIYKNILNNKCMELKK